MVTGYLIYYGGNDLTSVEKQRLCADLKNLEQKSSKEYIDLTMESYGESEFLI